MQQISIEIQNGKSFKCTKCGKDFALQNNTQENPMTFTGTISGAAAGGFIGGVPGAIGGAIFGFILDSYKKKHS